jgi:hypothetical protein
MVFRDKTVFILIKPLQIALKTFLSGEQNDVFKHFLDR